MCHMHRHVLQGSAVFPRMDAQRQEHVQTLRALLKSSIRSAWAKVCRHSLPDILMLLHLVYQKAG